MSEKAQEFAFQLDKLKKQKNVAEAPKPEPVAEAPLTFRGPSTSAEKQTESPLQAEKTPEAPSSSATPFNPNLNEVEESTTLQQFKKDDLYY